MTIAFIGLGAMGRPMSRNLHRHLESRSAGPLRAFDVDKGARDAAGADGLAPSPTAAEAATGAEIVVLALPAAAHVDAALGEHGVLQAMAPDGLVIDCSTIDPESARRFAAQAAQGGRAYLDAPMSGGVAGAAAATLTFMVGAEPDALARAEPVLSAMGKAVRHAGPAGAGAAAKLCNNMLLGISMIGAAEAFAMARRLGLDAKTFYDIASTSSGRCWSLTDCCPEPGPQPNAPSSNGYKPGFAAALMLKDLKLAMTAAQAAGAPTPLGAHATQIYQMMNAAGGADMDFSGVIRWLEGVELGPES